MVERFEPAHPYKDLPRERRPLLGEVRQQLSHFTSKELSGSHTQKAPTNHMDRRSSRWLSMCGCPHGTLMEARTQILPEVATRLHQNFCDAPLSGFHRWPDSSGWYINDPWRGHRCARGWWYCDAIALPRAQVALAITHVKLP